MSKPNKFLYYSVLTGSFVLSGAAMIVAYNMVMGSYKRSLEKEEATLRVEYYTGTYENVAEEQSAQEWLNDVLTNSSAKVSDDIVGIRSYKLSDSFTKMGWWDYESFIEFYKSEDVSFAEISAFQTEDLGQNKAGDYSWVISLPVTITSEDSKIDGILKVGIEQESFSGHRKNMRIVSWQMM